MQGRRKDDERFPLEISISAIETSEEVQFLGSIRDQTDRQKMTAMLAQSEKLASIGLLSAGVAHEINNPLAFVGNNLAVLDRDLLGILDLLVAYEAADPILRDRDPALMDELLAIREDLDWDYVRSNLGRMLTRTREGVGRVASIVQTMRGLARTAPPELESASLSGLVTAALDLIQGRVRKDGIEVRRRDPEKSMPALSCVPTLISQVLVNLLINAIQAIETSSKAGEKILSVDLRREGMVQIVEITDSGDGIAGDVLPKLFDPFFTTKEVGEGTGLGLSITHGIIAGHGGQIEVEGRPGLGARFRLRLPEGGMRASATTRDDFRSKTTPSTPTPR
jgi:C4-dicarboxylate-specific signal transduction histidine kinase